MVLSVLTLGSAGCDGCGATEEDPEVVLQTVDELLEAGDPGAALALLDRHALADTEQGLLYSVEAWIMSGEYELAQSTLTSRVDLDSESIVLLEDSCAMGALAALESDDSIVAGERLAPCEGRERVDLEAIRMRLATDAPDLRAYDRMLERIHGSEASPELDIAAQQLEATLRERSEATDDLVLSIALLRRAYLVGQDPELGDFFIEKVFEAADSVLETDRQQAATFLEVLYLQQVEGLELSDEVTERATDAAEIALFPIYVGNLWDRYERKFSEEDAADGILDLETRTFSVGTLDSDERMEEVLTWYFQRIERPRPRPTPDIFANIDVCIDRAADCTFSFQAYATMAYEMNDLERTFLAENPDVTFVWRPNN